MNWLIKKFRNSLARKIVFQMLMAGTLLSLGATAIQIYISYQKDLVDVVDEIENANQSFRSSFEQALWDFNFTQVEVLLDGVSANSNIGYLLIEAATGEYWIRGAFNAESMISKTYDLMHVEGDATDKIGKFTVGVTFENAKNRAWSHFITLLFSNLVKAAIASIVMLLLFGKLVSVHLRQIANHVAEDSWMTAANPLSLKRKMNRSPDDLDAIVSALNEAKSNYIASYNKLENEISMRRATELRLEKQTVALKKSSLRLQIANQEQAEFTYAISHDLKSPTNTVRMINDELTEAYSDQLGEDGRELLDMSQKTIVRMGDMIEYVLHYSTAVNKEMCLASIDLNQLLVDIQLDLRGEIKKSAAIITVGNLPVIVGDVTQIRLLFQNVISNAIKFCEPGVPPEVGIQLCDDCAPDEVKFSIRDNGIGIAPEDRVSVFSLFNKLHSHDHYPGSGIGLALCQRIANNHNGSINFRDHASNDTIIDIVLAA